MKREIYIESGKRINQLRKSHGYTREQLAELVDISPKFLYEIEVGRKGFSAQTLGKMASILNVSCDYILFGSREFEHISDIDYILAELSDEKVSEIIKIFNSIYNLVML